MKKLLRVVSAISLLAFALVVAGCKNNPDEKAYSDNVKENVNNGVIKGKVVYQTGVTDCSGIDVFLEKLDSSKRSATVTESAELGRAANTVFYAKTETKSDGSYEFNKLPDGDYTIYAVNEDEAAYRSATIAAGSTVTVENLQLVLKGSISGTLKVTNGKAAGSIVGIAGTSYIAFVAEDGTFTISGIPVGKHKLCVMTNGKYEAFATEYDVNGKTIAEAGEISVTVDDDSSESGISYVTVKATDKGIQFSGNILNNIHDDITTDNGSFYSTTSASAFISIKDNDSGVEMIQKFIKMYNYSSGWNLVYPLVEKDKVYNFTVKAYYSGWTIYEENFTIKAQGGLGEYKIENVDKYGVELTDDRVIQRTGKPVYTNNKNVKVQREAVLYSLFRDDGLWITGSEDYPRWLDTTDGKMDLKNISSVHQAWQNYEGSIDAPLSGYGYTVNSFTWILLTGWTYDGTVVFKMNDRVQKKGSWGGEKVKKLITYGIGFIRKDTNGKSFTESYRTEEEMNAIFEGNNLSLSNMPGTKKSVVYAARSKGGKEVTYPYTEIIEIADSVYEPQQIPVITMKKTDSNYSLIFKGWRIGTSWSNDNFTSGSSGSTFPNTGYDWNENSLFIIDGNKAGSLAVYAVFEVVPSSNITATFKLSEDTDKVYASFVSQVGDGAFGRFDVPTEPVKEGYVFNGWYYYSEDGERYSFNGAYSGTFDANVTFYADFAKKATVTLMDGDTKINTVNLYVGASVGLIDQPEKTGYFFEGWYTDKELTKKVKTIADGTTVLYAKWVKPETWWTGDSNGLSPTISSDKLNNLSIGDSLYFEIYYNQPSNYSISAGNTLIYFTDAEYNYNKKYIESERTINGGEKLLLSYTFNDTDSDANMISYIKRYGLYVSYNWGSIRIKGIYYVKGPRFKLTLYDGKNVLDTIEAAPGVFNISRSIKDGYLVNGLYTDSEFKNVWGYYVTKDEKLYVKFVEAKTLWTGDSYNDGLSSDDMKEELAIGDTLCFEIYSSYKSSGKLYYYDGDGRYERNLSYRLNPMESAFITYTFSSSDEDLISTIKKYGLGFNTSDSDVKCKKLYVLKGTLSEFVVQKPGA